jgi:uncharacterized protein YqeY
MRMTLFEKIEQDSLSALLDADKAKRLLLSTLVGEAGAIGKNNGNRPTTDAEVVKVIGKFIDSAKEMLALDRSYESSEQAKYEIDVLSAYMPIPKRQLHDQELFNIVYHFFVQEEKTKQLMGKIMKYLKYNYEGQYDGKTAQGIVAKFVNG